MTDTAATERLLAEVAERRNDAEFMARLRDLIDRTKPILDRLADDRPIRVKDTAKHLPREKP